MIMDRQQAKDFFRTEGIAQILISHESVWDAFVDFVYDRSPDIALATARFCEDDSPTVIVTTKEKP